MRLHILTACSRPDFLPAWAAELSAVSVPGVEIHRHVGFDLARRHVGGQAVKNALLDSIPADDAGWVWIGDDDNTLDPAMLAAVAEYDARPVDVVIFAQRRGRQVAPPCAVLNRVDAAQFVARRSAIGAHRLPEAYNGDGLLIAAIAKTARMVYDQRVLTNYNGRA
ncbi:MAG: hypothetical protein AELANPGJ_02011 [Anaerolineae bacterium]|nr:hypothetical protein [Anaerolineae bacterium]